MGSSESTQKDVPRSAYENAQRRQYAAESEKKYYPNLNAETTIYNKESTTYNKEPTVKNINNIGPARNLSNVTHYPNELKSFPKEESVKQTNVNHRTVLSNKEFNDGYVFRQENPYKNASCPKEELVQQVNRSQLEQVNNGYVFYQQNPYDSASCSKKEPVKQVNSSKNDEVNNIYKLTQKTPTAPAKKDYSWESLCKPPSEINNLKEFMRTWNIWKEQMQSFLIIVDNDKKDYHKWGNLLLNRMGSVSHQILQHLIFDKEEDKNNYSILIDKFNSYHKFITSSKSPNESTMNYIERLKADSVKDMKNIDDMVKQKLEKEIEKLCKERFIAITCSKIPDFKFEKTFKSLTMAEIAFLWGLCDNSAWKENESCKYCGRLHPKDKCFAFGKECNKCKRRNHFCKYCPGVMYVTNCSFCGGDHGMKKCLAYGEKCHKCNKVNHFSWMCSKSTLLRNCKFCGLDHVMDRSKCPALKSFCSICRTTGHYDVKCPNN